MTSFILGSLPLTGVPGVLPPLKLITFPTMRRSRIDQHICSRKAASPRPPVLAKQSVVPGQNSTGTGGQFEGGVNSLLFSNEIVAALPAVLGGGQGKGGEGGEGGAVPRRVRKTPPSPPLPASPGPVPETVSRSPPRSPQPRRGPACTPAASDIAPRTSPQSHHRQMKDGYRRRGMQ